MIVYPAEHARNKDSAFASIAGAAGGGRRLVAIPLSFRDFPETNARTDTALKRAKKQPEGSLGQWLKRQLLRGQYNWSRRHFAANPGDVAMAWNGLTGSRYAFMAGAKDAGAARLYVELAPLPGRITLDPQGINAESALSRDAAFYAGWARGRTGLSAWRSLGDEIQARPSRRTDVGQAAGKLPDAPFLFVPLQVPDDSQIRLFADWAKDMPGFIGALCRASASFPPGWHVRIKEHPSAGASLAGPLADAVKASGNRLVIDNATDTFQQVAASRGVVTVNSSVGLQAFFHDKPVIVTGRTFFNIPGLVTTVQTETGLRNAFAEAERLTYDAALRDAFMSYLTQVYYPRLTAEGDRWTVNPEAVRAKLAEARRHRG